MSTRISRKERFVEWCGYLAILVGIYRICEYVYFGDIHHGLAILWIIHAMAIGIVLIALVRFGVLSQRSD